eukprot:1185928-Prorocentrum_minimum.AAC.1
MHRRMSLAKGVVIDTDQKEVAESLNVRPWADKDRREAEVSRRKLAHPPLKAVSGELSLTTETLAAKRGRDTTLGVAMVATAFPERVFEWPKDAGPMRPSTLEMPQ